MVIIIKRGTMKTLTIDNWNELASFMKQADYHEYNSNPMTLLMWSNRYEVQFETFEHFALASSKMPGRHPIWLMPFCEMEYRKEAMDKLKELSTQYQIPYGIHSMTKEFKDWLLDQYPLEFLVWDCMDARDYVYDRKQQETLVGKKMQKRRNHYNAFINQYTGQYEYRALTKQDIPNIYQFLEEWKTEKEEDESIDAERIGIELFLENLDTLPIRGGCIYMNGKLEAFNITSKLSDDTVQIHVEKANKHIRGLYIAILKLFLETCEPEILYVNREDDLGLEELRKAKRDMQPIRQVQKLGSIHQALEIKLADASWDSNIRKLWLENFEDENEESTTYYFDRFYQQHDCYILTSEDELLCMLQMRPMKVMINQQEKDACFIVGVATNKEYEHCGYMKRLLNYAIKETSKTCDYLYLQAYDWEVYRDFGFDQEYKKARYKVKAEAYPYVTGSLNKTYQVSQLVDVYQTYTKDKQGYRLRDEAYYQDLFIPNATLWGEEIYCYEEQGNTHGYIKFSIQENTWVIQECIYDSEETLRHMLGCILQKSKNVMMMVDQQSVIEGRKKEELCMKVRVNNHAPFPLDNLFISENL